MPYKPGISSILQICTTILFVATLFVRILPALFPNLVIRMQYLNKKKNDELETIIYETIPENYQNQQHLVKNCPTLKQSLKLRGKFRTCQILKNYKTTFNLLAVRQSRDCLKLDSNNSLPICQFLYNNPTNKFLDDEIFDEQSYFHSRHNLEFLKKLNAPEGEKLITSAQS